MSREASIGTERSLSLEDCRRFFYERSDVSLGIVPQLLLDDAAAEAWTYFWYAARVVDDDLEAGRVTPEDLLRWLRGVPRSDAAGQALGQFWAHLPSHLDASRIRSDLEYALRGLARERHFTQPPSVTDYAALIHAKAGVPLGILNELLLPEEDPADRRRFSDLLAFSIQLGDDLRDVDRDTARGFHFVTRDELEAAHHEDPDETDPVGLIIREWREHACLALALLALECADRFVDPTNRERARLEANLWLFAIESAQLHEGNRPLHFPFPLEGLLRQGAPSTARLLAARRVLHNEPALFGPRKWDPRTRRMEVQRIQSLLPPLYATFEQEAQTGATRRVVTE